MRRLRDVLRLKYEAGLPQRAIARACGVGLGTVSTYLQRATAAGVTWPLRDDLDDGALEARLFPRATAVATDRVVPHWIELHQELKRPGVTLMLLWQEYRAQHPQDRARDQHGDDQDHRRHQRFEQIAPQPGIDLRLAAGSPPPPLPGEAMMVQNREWL